MLNMREKNTHFLIYLEKSPVKTVVFPNARNKLQSNSQVSTDETLLLNIIMTREHVVLFFSTF